MKTLAHLFCLLLSGMAPLSAEELPKLWPPEKFTHVVAYCYDYTKDPRGYSIVFPDGSLHAGVIRSTTVRLNEEQTATLRKTLTDEPEKEFPGAFCYDPHHAFVFYNHEWKPVAWVDICFLCGNYKAHPAGTAEYADLDLLEKFCTKIGLPNFEKSEGYTRLYQQEQPSAKKNRMLALPVEDNGDPFAGGDDDGDIDPFAD